DIVTFIVNQGAQIADFVNAVLDAVIAIANGGPAGVPKMVETALATSVPLLIGFLASLLGIGNLANKVKSVFHAVAKPVNRAIDKIINLITKVGKKLWAKIDEKKNRKPDRGKTNKNKEQELPTAKAEAKSITHSHNISGESPERLKSTLNSLRKKYSWIRGFKLEGDKPYSVWLLASRHKIYDKYSGLNEQERNQRRKESRERRARERRRGDETGAPLGSSQVRGFRNAGEVMERLGNLRNRMLKFGYEDTIVGIRGSSITGGSSKGGGFRWHPKGLKASDVDFLACSPKLEEELIRSGAHFKINQRLEHHQLEAHRPDIAASLEDFGEETKRQIGRKADAMILRKDFFDSLTPGEFIRYPS
ncbi:hypothetical protein ACF07K_18250, partial [Streptomyces sp. NPDC015350]